MNGILCALIDIQTPQDRLFNETMLEHCPSMIDHNRIDFVGGIRGMDELERRVDKGQDAIAFALYPTELQDVMTVADAGEVMPPKSTWFEPKLRSGVVVQLLTGERL